MREVYLDTEFHEDGETIDLISIGMVDDAGNEYYAVNSDMQVDRIRHNRWLMENVVRHLPLRLPVPTSGWADNQPPGIHLNMTDTRVKPKWVIANEVLNFLVPKGELFGPGPAVNLWAWYAAYDHVALAQLFGRMIDLPPGIPMWTNDLRQEAHRLGLNDDHMPAHKGREHHALDDAKHDRDIARYLATVRAQDGPTRP